MANESCVTYPANSAFLMVRDPLIKICSIPAGSEGEEKKPAPDPQAAAIILHQFIFWTDGKIRDQHQKRYHEAAAAKEGEVNQQDNGLWIYKDYDDLKDNLMGLFGRNKVIDNVQWLVTAGYLNRRTNPRYRWDKTLQYAVNIERVQIQINAVASFNSKLSEVPNQTDSEFETKRAIPEKTSKKTRNDKENYIAPAIASAQPAPSTSGQASGAYRMRAVGDDESIVQSSSLAGQESARAEHAPKRTAKTLRSSKHEAGDASMTDTTPPSKVALKVSPAPSEDKPLSPKRQEQVMAMNALAQAMGVVLVKADEKRYAQVAATLVASGITYAEFDLYVKRIRVKAKEQNWEKSLSVDALLAKGRPSEYVTAREKSRQNAPTDAQSGIQVLSMLDGRKNAYKRDLDPAYAAKELSK